MHGCSVVDWKKKILFSTTDVQTDTKGKETAGILHAIQKLIKTIYHIESNKRYSKKSKREEKPLSNLEQSPVTHVSCKRF